MRRKGFQESKSRRVEESAILARVEAALSTLARVERAPELSEDLRRRIARRRVGELGWGWVGAGAVAAIAIVVAVAVWPRGGGEVMRSGRREAQVAEVGVRAVEVEARMQRNSAGGAGDGAPTTAADGSCVEAGMGMPALQQRPGHGGDAETSPPYRTAVAQETGLPQGQEPFDLAQGGQAPAEREVAARMPLLREGIEGSQGEAGMGMPAVQGQEQAPAERDHALQNGGVILVLGRPAPVQVSGSYYAEVTLADGTKSVVDQAVERDAGGRPQMVRITYEQTEPNAASVQQGG